MAEKPGHILIIDDDDEVLLSAEMVLEDYFRGAYPKPSLGCGGIVEAGRHRRCSAGYEFHPGKQQRKGRVGLAGEDPATGPPHQHCADNRLRGYRTGREIDEKGCFRFCAQALEECQAAGHLPVGLSLQPVAEAKPEASLYPANPPDRYPPGLR